MTEFKGTPGPWERDRHGQRRGADGEQVVVWDAGIAWGQRTDTSEANALLIAAAPELLEALQEACEIIQDLNRELNNHGGMIDDETFPKGLAAIAKALGEGQ